MIPANASVAATENEAPHVSSRRDCFTIRFGYHDADYLLIDMLSARSGQNRLKIQEAPRSGQYEGVATRGGYRLWIRRGELWAP
jgi:hypothetical protein